ncbi:hypothetical protein PLESTB_001016200 [Pleodorina starrii]|uniref:Uncharacterized protein n=1 Tax=Pleodorina starrii TaxID=330485 RepID=A0A9W6BPT4_9CHLO|nr:hypothetical protein PLESTB_001016200 [Pleodorina starrii]
MAVIAPFLQRQLYDEAVTEMADELRLKAGLLDSSDSDTSGINGKTTRRQQWELPKADGGSGQEQALPPRRSSAEMLRRRKRTGVVRDVDRARDVGRGREGRPS